MVFITQAPKAIQNKLISRANQIANYNQNYIIVI